MPFNWLKKITFCAEDGQIRRSNDEDFRKLCNAHKMPTWTAIDKSGDRNRSEEILSMLPILPLAIISVLIFVVDNGRLLYFYPRRCSKLSLQYDTSPDHCTIDWTLMGNSVM